jgi:hypothetical protein
MKENEVKYKDLIEKINRNIDELKNNFSILISLITEEQKKEAKIPEGFISFDFIEPVPKLSGLENFLINRILNKEGYKHKIEFVLNKNKNDEIIQIFLKGEREHLNHILNACEWINKKLKENKEKKQETKTVPSELI